MLNGVPMRKDQIMPTAVGTTPCQHIKVIDSHTAGEVVRMPLRPMKKELKALLRDALLTARTTIAQVIKSTEGERNV